MQTTTLIRGRNDGEATWFFNALVTTKASMAETGGAYSLTEHMVTAASNPPMHVQVDEDEAFYLLDGEVEFEVDGKVVIATPGTFAFVARGAAHRFRVLTEQARMLVICSGKPSDNLEDFFVGMGEPATERALPPRRAPDEDRLAVLCARQGSSSSGAAAGRGRAPGRRVVRVRFDPRHAAAGGYETAVVCATRGEAGESRVRTDDLAACPRGGAARGGPHPRRRDRARPRPRRLRDDRTTRAGTRSPPPIVDVAARGAIGHRRVASRCRRHARRQRRSPRPRRDTGRHARGGRQANARPAATYLWCLARSSMAQWAAHAGEAGRACTPASSGHRMRTSRRFSTCRRTCRSVGRRSATPVKPALTTNSPPTCSTSSSPSTASGSCAATTCSQTDRPSNRDDVVVRDASEKVTADCTSASPNPRKNTCTGWSCGARSDSPTRCGDPRSVAGDDWRG